VSRWAEVPAFRNGDVVTLDGDLVTRPGPRMVAALEGVAKVFSAWRERRTASPVGERGLRR
jgi:ABC-type Fe3+-hydroxamate transport system substrate-binding protein